VNGSGLSCDAFQQVFLTSQALLGTALFPILALSFIVLTQPYPFQIA